MIEVNCVVRPQELVSAQKFVFLVLIVAPSFWPFFYVPLAALTFCCMEVVNSS